MVDGRMSRRTLLRRGLVGGVILAGGGALGLWSRPGRRKKPGAQLHALSAEGYSVLSAIADRMIPPAKGFPRPAAVHTVEKVDHMVSRLHPADRRDLSRALVLVENALFGFLLDGRITPFTKLSPEAQDRALRDWESSRLTLRRSVFRALKGLVVAAYYTSPETYSAIGYPGPPDIYGTQGDQ